MYQFIFKVLLFTVDVRAQNEKWWDAVEYQPAELVLSSGIFKGKMIDFDGANIEIYRGKFRLESLVDRAS